MVAPSFFFDKLKSHGIDFFAGVPDSLLKTFCAYVSDHQPGDRHIITTNEGSAVALAMGYHLAAGGIPLVYMQNSGIGNAVNPLLSLVDTEVYGIPMLLLIGWRGEPGRKDEPQHIKQGKVLLPMLEAMGIPYDVIDEDATGAAAALDHAVTSALENSCAHALVVKKGAFDAYQLQSTMASCYPFSREEVIQRIVDHLDDMDIVVSTTGMASRELFEYRAQTNAGHQRDFLTVGGMGHASQIALGIAGQKPDRRILCIDGDGAALMHLGALATNGASNLANFRHIIINNGAHDSVGGQPTLGFDVDLLKIAEACNYKKARRCESQAQLSGELEKLNANTGPSLLEIRVNKGSRKDLGRPTTTPVANKKSFMAFAGN